MRWMIVFVISWQTTTPFVSVIFRIWRYDLSYTVLTDPFQSIEHFDDSGPCVVMASPGMMQSGLSRELFENWCTDRRNGVIIAGYCVEGTLAKQILSLPAEVPTMSGQMLPLKCSVDYISFSAHTDFQQTSEFIRELRPHHIVSLFVMPFIKMRVLSLR